MCRCESTLFMFTLFISMISAVDTSTDTTMFHSVTKTLIYSYLWELTPGELCWTVVLHNNALVLHRRLHHHKVIQHLILVGGVKPSLSDLLVESRCSWGWQKKKRCKVLWTLQTLLCIIILFYSKKKSSSGRLNISRTSQTFSCWESAERKIS